MMLITIYPIYINTSMFSLPNFAVKLSMISMAGLNIGFTMSAGSKSLSAVWLGMAAHILTTLYMLSGFCGSMSSPSVWLMQPVQKITNQSIDNNPECVTHATCTEITNQSIDNNPECVARATCTENNQSINRQQSRVCGSCNLYRK